ncbi:hypothetical protein RRSWK_05426 [Rhodopirellula sp. SWK7]|nr:hypothetical protein RRSWK_05426 [Rhodopirellula sp. SWK7]
MDARSAKADLTNCSDGKVDACVVVHSNPGAHRGFACVNHPDA